MTRTISRILVPTDFSPHSDAALTYAKALARTFGASLHLLHVLDDVLTSGVLTAEAYGPMPVGVDEGRHPDAGTRLCDLLSGDEVTRFHARGAVVFGTTSQSITRYAAEHGIDLIVMGTHGRTGVAHALIGSVAERVVRTAPCPVLTVRESGAVKVHSVDAERVAMQLAVSA
jgi:universal stress protein A